ncbi:hypothetical protein V1511DRAFT_503447 [Dipodascopsis uninucleata]
MSATTTMSITTVPLAITTKNVKASFKQNKDLSSAIDDVLKIQKLSWTVRTALKYAPITLQIYYYVDENGVEHYDVDQILPAGLKSDEYRTLDSAEREKDSPVFGPVIASSKRISVDEASAIAPFLAKDWDNSCQANGLIYAYARGDTTKPKGVEWESHQTFGFADVQNENGESERKYVVRLVFKAPSTNDVLEKRLVYDFSKEGF